jgi:Mg2+ and Co2+ transporter CorA
MILQEFNNISEFVSLFKFYYNKKTKKSKVVEEKDLRWCYEILESVSRSFATVIEELPTEIRDPVIIK